MSANGYEHAMIVEGHPVTLVTATVIDGLMSVNCDTCNLPLWRNRGGRSWYCSECDWLWKPRLKSLKNELRRTAMPL